MSTNQQKPDNFLIWSILTTVCCCMPLGIVAIIYSSKVDPAWTEGRYQDAEDAAKAARTWTFIGAGLGILSYIMLFLFGCMTIVLNA